MAPKHEGWARPKRSRVCVSSGPANAKDGVDEVVTGGFKIHSQGDGTGSWCLLNRHKDRSSESQHLQESELGGMGS